MFWLLSFLILLVTAVIALYPMLRGRSPWQPFAFAVAGAIPVAGLYLYDHVGTPDAIHMPPPVQHPVNTAGDIDQMVEQLRGRLSETEADLEGWILLTRTLKNLQRYDEALQTAQTAVSIAPGNALAVVELVEARIFTSPDGRIGAEDVHMLETALEAEPGQQKALWLLGIAAAQAGDYQQAIEHWESLLDLVEPGSNVAQSVTQQINEARSALGQPPVAVAAAAGPSLPVSVSLADQIEVPSRAVLFVIARAAGVDVGPPLAVKRIIGPSFPVNVALSDDDAMVAGSELSAQTAIQLQARLSLSGTPAAQAGDWQSSVKTVELAEAPHVELLLDQRVE